MIRIGALYRPISLALKKLSITNRLVYFYEAHFTADRESTVEQLQKLRGGIEVKVLGYG